MDTMTFAQRGPSTRQYYEYYWCRVNARGVSHALSAMLLLWLDCCTSQIWQPKFSVDYATMVYFWESNFCLANSYISKLVLIWSTLCLHYPRGFLAAKRQVDICISGFCRFFASSMGVILQVQYTYSISRNIYLIQLLTAVSLTIWWPHCVEYIYVAYQSLSLSALPWSLHNPTDKIATAVW